ncbi:MAG: class I SAM-dependent methyltransferase, partial [Anaerolineae bacterium]
GGVLAFETRNPEYRAWEQWNRANSFQKTDSPFGPLEEWLDVTHVADGRVYFEATNVFSETGEVLVVKSELRFRSLKEVTESLQKNRFVIQHVYGDWKQKPFEPTDPVMLFVAQCH